MADADAVAKKAAIEALLFSPTPSEEQAQREEPRRIRPHCSKYSREASVVHSITQVLASFFQVCST